MRARRFALLITLYITLDFTSPFIDGAFTFDADDSVDGVHLHRQQTKVNTASVPVRVPVPERRDTAKAVTLATPERDSRPLGGWFVDLRRAHQPAAATPLITEDH